jgi:hypothetical protein
MGARKGHVYKLATQNDGSWGNQGETDEDVIRYCEALADMIVENRGAEEGARGGVPARGRDREGAPVSENEIVGWFTVLGALLVITAIAVLV